MNDYFNMWQDFGKAKANIYVDYKFKPTHRIGLTNYLREEQIYKFLEPNEKDVVLDVGCASGRQLFKIAKKIKKGYGIDIAQSFIDKANYICAKNSIQNLYFKRAVIEKIPFEDSFFDKIICAEVLEHVSDKNTALKELLRVLKNGGNLIITVPNLNSDATLWGRFLRLIKKRKFVPLENFSNEDLIKHGDAHVREFNRQSLKEWLQDNNLEVLNIKSVSFIDGPYIDFLLKVPLHITFLRNLIIYFEKFLTHLNLFLGRNLIVKLRKK
jgi:ubiquinone/menaquinone biosynthesis C-methylase UbiE